MPAPTENYTVVNPNISIRPKPTAFSGIMFFDMIKILFDGPEEKFAKHTLVLAHGAGAPMDSDFMNYFAAGLAEHEVRVARFEFPYMAHRRVTGIKRPPGRQVILLETWREVVAQIGKNAVNIGGKSMGGRMATLLAAAEDAPPIRRLICLGYPFHPPGKPEILRTDHLLSLSVPTLIVQGDRDPMGNSNEVGGYKLSPAIQLHWCPDGNHDLAPRKNSGFTEKENWVAAMNTLAKFLE